MKAFPLSSDSAEQKGLDLRDYFAAKAMQSLLSNRYIDGWLNDKNQHEIDTFAKIAYRFGDAMMKEREKK